MLSGFFVKLKDHKIPVSIKEWLTLLEAMQKDVISPSIDEFYYLSRTTLVKDEQNFDKFDRAFGDYGYNPEGVRIGQDKSRSRSAVKVWDAREYRNLDDSVELGTRNIKVALRRLRKFAREGAPEELDLD